MNETTGFSLDGEEDVVMAAISAFMGGLILVLNFCLLLFISKVLIFTRNKNNRPSILVQTCFVCTHDTFSGLFLMLIGVIKVHNVFTAHMCGYLVFICFAVQVVSQGNITCACTQRYLMARNLGKTTSKPAFHTTALLLVNGFIGVAALAIYISGTKVNVNNIPPEPVICNLGSVLNQTATAIGSVNFLFGIPCIIVANVMCFLTIFKLRHAGTKITPSDPGQPGTAGTSEASSSQLASGVRQSTQAKQNKAIFTLLLIVLFFNVSIIPSVVAYVINNLNIYMSFILRRTIILTLFMNSLFNPLIIVTRVNDVRTPIKTLFIKAASVVRLCF